jgi:hypothetical protein
METRNHVLEGQKKHFSPEDTARFLRLCKRIIPGISSLVNYLDSCPAELDLRPTVRREVDSQTSERSEPRDPETP